MFKLFGISLILAVIQMSGKFSISLTYSSVNNYSYQDQYLLTYAQKFVKLNDNDTVQGGLLLLFKFFVNFYL